MKVYIAAPLFWEGELEYNQKIAKAIADAGHEVVLPQEYKGNTEELYEQCMTGVEDCDVVVALLNGTDTDSGTSFECGYARGLNKYIIGFRSDIRENHVDGLNLMLRYGVTMLVQNIEGMLDAIDMVETDMNTMEPL
jgi:nucleoside 2-deoxyribosyltransferase